MTDRIINDNADDNVQHGIDDDPNNDAAKGAGLGAVGGGVAGAATGAMAGPAGAVVGAVVGGVVGGVASGAAVSAVDAVDNDDTITGIGKGQTRDVEDRAAEATSAYDRDTTIGNDLPGVQSGGTTASGAPDTRGLSEKAADAITGDNIDDKTGRRVD